VARVLITGSADGLGLEAARQLVAEGHDPVVHGRSPERAREARDAAGVRDAVHGDLASLAQTRKLAEQANELGPFDAVIHNAGVYLAPRCIETEDGLPHVFQINTVAPYLLTVLIETPRRLVYLSSGLNRSGDPALDDIRWKLRRWSASQAYADTKLHDVLLAFGVARRFPDTRSNAVDPGWVATRMGGRSAPGSVEDGAATQVWLAVADETAETTGGYFHRLRPDEPHPAARDEARQDELLALLGELTGTGLG
jgi:NAD(P)-dependent dehydrogenase (short-subunit alcohol dehydrogenase family)